MEKNAPVVKPPHPIQRLVELMKDSKLRRVMVVDGI